MRPLKSSFCRKILREFLVTAVFLKDCGVHFLKLRSSPCRRRPPCNCNRAGEVENSRWDVGLFHNRSRCFVTSHGLRMRSDLHDSVHPSTVALPHASEPRLSTYVPYLRAEVNTETQQNWDIGNDASTDRHVPLWSRCLL